MCCGGDEGAEPNKGNVRWMWLQEERETVSTWGSFYSLEGPGELNQADDPPSSVNCLLRLARAASKTGGGASQN